MKSLIDKMNQKEKEDKSLFIMNQELNNYDKYYYYLSNF